MQTDQNIWVNVFDENNNSLVKMELEDVVKRITARELPGIFEMEAIKALAVVIRTSVVKKLKAFEGIGCQKHKEADICTSMKGCSEVTDMALLKGAIGEGFDEIYNLACRAGEETSGIIITCGGRPIFAEYHLSCGGGTVNSEDLLGNSIVYLRKVLCSYCFNTPNFEDTVDIPVAELENKLKVRLTEGSSIKGPDIEGVIQEVERDETGRIKKIKIGGKYFSGNEVKDLLGLASSRFGWDPHVIRFKVRGKGSGLGMCLYGANSMAQMGKSFSEILKYYFTNISLTTIDAAGNGVPLKGKTFVIDPGHGGEDGGDETGPTGLREKDVNLYIANKLSEYLQKDGAKTFLTRYGDENVTLVERVEIANRIRPNFLISIHQNSFFARGVSGTEVYYYRGDREGEKLGRFVLDNIVKSLGTANRGYSNADFYILRESKVSAIVVECMYISNPQEEEKLKSDLVKDEIAKSIYRGIMDYYGI